MLNAKFHVTSRDKTVMDDTLYTYTAIAFVLQSPISPLLRQELTVPGWTCFLTRATAGIMPTVMAIKRRGVAGLCSRGRSPHDESRRVLALDQNCGLGERLGLGHGTDLEGCGLG